MNLHKKLIATLVTFFLVAGSLLAPAIPASALAGTTILSTTSGPPGTSLTVTGTSFANSTAYTVRFNGLTYASGTTSVSGGFSVTFSVPTLPRSSYTVAASDSGGPDVNQSFTITPSVSVTGSPASPGDTIYMSGNGFSASGTAQLYFNSVYVATANTDSFGTFSNTPLIVPELSATVYSAYAYDVSGGVSSLASYVSVRPKITISATSVAVGSSVSVSGKGFAASSTINFYLDSTLISTTISSDTNGSFSSISVAIPTIAGGGHTLKAQDASSNSYNVAITIKSAVTMTPLTGPAGTVVTLTGNGFLAGTNVTVSYNAAGVATTPATVTTDSNGTFTTTFKVPAGAAGAYTVIATEGTNSSTATFTSIATGSISPLKGNTGTSVSVTGQGFKASAPISINYNNAVAGNATSDVNGNFSVTVTIPNAPTGDHALMFTDGTNSISATFSVTPTAAMDPTSGVVGSNIALRGTGFAASRALSVKYDGVDMITPTPTSDSSGTFAVSFKAPVSKGGNHQVTISDGVSTQTFTFAMDSTAPPAPSPSLPITNTQADAIPSLKWTDVTDPSGVTYNLQISKDAAFAALVIDKTGLTNSGYTLALAEKLPNRSKQEPYFWRVQAVDAASNASAWSAASTFFIGFVLQTWALYTIFGVVALLLGILGFWLGKRRAMSI